MCVCVCVCVGGGGGGVGGRETILRGVKAIKIRNDYKDIYQKGYQ